MSESERKRSGKAAALKYDPEKNGAPVVVASGMGYMADKITEAAMQAGVPVYEDDSLATLLTQLKLGAEIPKELYQAIVEIYLYFLHFSVHDQEKTMTREAGGPARSGQEERPAEIGLGEKEEQNDMAGERPDAAQPAEEPARDTPRHEETAPAWSAGSPFIRL